MSDMKEVNDMKNVKNVVETRKLNSESLRSLCIKNNWCNACNNSEYEELLNICDKDNITAEDIAAIAETIDQYTKDNPYNGEVQTIAFMVARQCYSIFKIAE